MVGDRFAFFRSVLCAAVLTLCAAGFHAAGIGAAQAQSGAGMIAQIQQSGRLTVGTTLKTPYAMQAAGGGTIGHEIDVARRLAADLGVEAIFVQVPEAQLMDQLLSGQVDIVAAGFAITPERALKAAFSRPYAVSGLQLVTTRRAARRGRQAPDFNDDGFSLAVTLNTPSEVAANTFMPVAEISRYQREDDARRALMNGDVDGLLAVTPFPELLVAQMPDAFALPLNRPVIAAGEAFAVRKGDRDFVDFLNAWITARELDGFLGQTRGYWFNTRDWTTLLTERVRIERPNAPPVAGNTPPPQQRTAAPAPAQAPAPRAAEQDFSLRPTPVSAQQSVISGDLPPEPARTPAPAPVPQQPAPQTPTVFGGAQDSSLPPGTVRVQPQSRTAPAPAPAPAPAAPTTRPSDPPGTVRLPTSLSPVRDRDDERQSSPAPSEP